MFVIRGAVCAENTEKSISENSMLLVSSIMQRNALSPDDVECVFFTATDDLDACYPATSVRTRLLPNACFLCCAEMPVKGSMRHVIRVAVCVSKPVSPKHCYLGEAAALRKDLK